MEEKYETSSFAAAQSAERVLKYYLISLGCSKNLVESEEMMAKLSITGMVLVNDPEEADLLIVNTCGFIEPAKEESIDVILELAQTRKRNPWQRLVVVGCLVERYRKELKEDLHEVDAFIGVRDKDTFLKLAWDLLERPPVNPNLPSYPYAPRLLTTPPHMVYLRISDGCFHRCNYCAIPAIRGTLRSRPIDEIIREAKALAAGGAKELIIVSQDTTSYGIDLYKRQALVELLTELEQIDGIDWIRLMYLYPNMVDKRLIDFFARSQKLVSYIDLPIQHGAPEILQAMNRGTTSKPIIQAVEKLREARSKMTFRTTVIVGFPGEKQKHFQTLLDLLERLDFDRIGVFKYSREEGTSAATLPGHVSSRIKEKRYQALNSWASDRARIKNGRFIGETLAVLIDRKSQEGDGYWGRYEGQAPDVDGQVYVQGGSLVAGRFAPVRISSVDEDNLYGYVNTEIGCAL